MAIAPYAELTQLLHLRMVLLGVVLDRQVFRIENANVAAQAMQDPSALKCKQL